MVRKFIQLAVNEKILIVFLFASSSSLCLSQTQHYYADSENSNETSLSISLEQITKHFEQNEVIEVEKLITSEFLSQITNVSNKVLVEQYTSKWIENYADAFPETFLIHCMAGGESSATKKIYNSLTNNISKNCARWSLMVRGETLNEEPIVAKQGTFFRNDHELWDDLPTRSGENSIYKQFYLQRRTFLPLLYREIGCGVVIVRDDHVPVPWGNEPKPNINFFPYLVPKSDLLLGDAAGRQASSRRSGYTSFLPSISLYYGTLPPVPDNKVWEFFSQMYSPYLFLGGQIISSKQCDEINGRIHIFSRSLVSKKLFCKQIDIECSEQDLMISKPINFSLHSEGKSFHIEFYTAGPDIPWSEPLPTKEFNWEILLKARKSVSPQ